MTYLANKPPDLGPTCYQYEIYGHCMNGLMCRFGSNHIDTTTGKNILRPAEQGGVIDRLNINVLSKDVQFQLRKKKYDFGNRTTKTEEGNTTTKKEEESTGETKTKTDESAGEAEKSQSALPTFNSTAYDKPRKLVDFSNKVYIAPLTTVGNTPFRRVLKDYGADITCGEMAMGFNLLQGQSSEWALLRKHASEDIFGVQIAGAHADMMAKVAKLLENETNTDFVDLNCGCPIDIVCNRGSGSALMQRQNKLVDIVASMAKHLTRSVTVKIRTGWNEKDPTAHKLLPHLQRVSKGRIAAVMIHGRSRLQRYGSVYSRRKFCALHNAYTSEGILICSKFF
jgi:tRNA-dihydrouridine synthase 3